MLTRDLGNFILVSYRTNQRLTPEGAKVNARYPVCRF